MRRGLGLLVLAVVSAVLSLQACSSHAELQKLQQSVKPDGSLSLLVIGDWGRNGEFNQSVLASQMGRIGEELDIDFVVSTGDNFYENGLTGIDDTEFENSFTKVYTGNGLQKPWYSVLGNHDYRGNVLAQLNLALQRIDGRWTCKRSFILDAEIAEFFFVDTTPLVMHYWTHPKGNHYDWRQVAPRQQYVTRLLKDLDSALKESTAKWKFVVGHHTIRSVSIHADTAEMVELVLPILKANGVDFYINGHDHCLEHISSRDSPIQFVTSGGGSKAWRGVYEPNADKLEFFYDGQGFMSMRVTQGQVRFAFHDITGAVMYEYALTKEELRTVA